MRAGIVVEEQVGGKEGGGMKTVEQFYDAEELAFQLNDIDKAVCAECTYDRNDLADAEGNCEDSSDGKHRFVHRTAWAAITATTWFDADSTEKAGVLFNESPLSCITCRQLTPEEVRDLLSGTAHLEIAVIRKP